MSDFSDEENPETSGIEPGSIAKNRSEIRSGLDALQGLEELSSIQDEVYLRSVGTDYTWDYNSGWKDHLQLRNLSLYNPIIDSNLARDIIPLHFLKSLILVRPDVTDDTMIEFFGAMKAGSRVVLVGPMPSTLMDDIKEAVTAVQPKGEIVYTEATADEDDFSRSVQLWVRQQLERGMMFEAKGTIIWPRHKEKSDIRA
jgi:hypothetical protein